MGRTEYVAWCKRRALAYLPDDLQGAFTSMASDMANRQDTACPDIIGVGLQLLMIGDLNTPEKMRRWIEGFN